MNLGLENLPSFFRARRSVERSSLSLLDTDEICTSSDVEVGPNLRHFSHEKRFHSPRLAIGHGGESPPAAAVEDSCVEDPKATDDSPDDSLDDALVDDSLKSIEPSALMSVLLGNQNARRTGKKKNKRPEANTGGGTKEPEGPKRDERDTKERAKRDGNGAERAKRDGNGPERAKRDERNGPERAKRDGANERDAPVFSLQDLERKMYSSLKSVSALELLKKPKQETIVLSDEDTKPLAGILGRYPAKKKKNSKGVWSLKVCLKVPPHALRLIDAPPSCPVTLKLPKEVLVKVSRMLNPLYTSGTGKGDAKSGVFAMMMKRASENSYPKLTLIQKLKGLEPSAIPREMMHVAEETFAPIDMRKPGMKPRNVKSYESIESESTKSDGLQPLLESTFETEPAYSYSPASYPDIQSYIHKRAPLSLSSAPHKALLEPPDKSALNWPQRFQPKAVDALLIRKSQKRFLNLWFANAFEILRTQSTKVPRAAKLREKRRRKDDFVVDDYVQDDTDEDAFVPLLIIHAPSGAAKTAAVYAAIRAIQGYVHEINTGQQRSRKDLLSSLKEFCTTQILKKDGRGVFQKGVVLFEDCDILFEQDKTFWSVVQEVMNFLKRPLVLTVQDLLAIPKNIVEIAEEQNSILALEIESREALQQYLWMCCFSCGFDLSDNVLETVTRNGPDVRRCLMHCQWLCHKERGGHVRVDIPKVLDSEPLGAEIDPDIDPELINPELASGPSTEKISLEEMCQRLDALSAGDVIGTNTHSALLHAVQPNELLDIYVIDDSCHLRQKTLPHEANYGDDIQRLSKERREDPIAKSTFNSTRSLLIEFCASRAKKIPRYIQELFGRAQTRSRSESSFFEPELQGLPENSMCYSITPGALYADLAPHARDWARFQRLLEEKDAQSMATGSDFSEAQFLGWRRFYRAVDEVLQTIPETQHL